MTSAGRAKKSGLTQTTLSDWGFGSGTPRGKGAVEEFRSLGYWRSAEFLPGCYYRRTGAEKVVFCGVIATARILRRGTQCTFITIGCDNGVYVDLVLSGQARGDLLHYAILEGEGVVHNGAVNVKKIKGIPLGVFSSSQSQAP